MTRFARLLCGIGMVALTACAAPTVKKHDISSGEFKAEQKAQRQYVVRARLKYIARMHDVVYPLLVGATDLCGEDVALKDGLVLGNEHDYEDTAWREAAKAELGLDSRPTVLHTVKGSPSAFAGFQVGDKIVGVNGRGLRSGADSTKRLYDLANDSSDENDGATQALPQETRVTYRVERDGQRLDIATVGVPACSYGVYFVNDSMVNAFTDGQNMFFTAGMMNIVDDYELATVVAHEMGHNIMGHLDAKHDNNTIGKGVGLIFDILAALAGVNTQGLFLDIGGEVGAGAHSQGFESEADYVSVYIMARAGYQVDKAGDIWRKMAAQSGGLTIQYASTHPTSAERALQIRKTATEVEKKIARGELLIPDAQPYESPKAVNRSDEAETPRGAR